MIYEIEVFARSTEGRFIPLVSTSERGISDRLELRSTLNILSERFPTPDFSIEVTRVDTVITPLDPADLLRTEEEALNYYINGRDL